MAKKKAKKKEHVLQNVIAVVNIIATTISSICLIYTTFFK